MGNRWVGTALNIARSEWLLSRVYALVGRVEPSLFHAKKSLQLCLTKELGAFDTGFAYEALARAYEVAGNLLKRDENVELGYQSAKGVEKERDRIWLLKNLNTVASLSLPEW